MNPTETPVYDVPDDAVPLEAPPPPTAMDPNLGLKNALDWGHINFESANGVIQSNCRAVEFTTADEMNEWFRKAGSPYAAQIFPMDNKLVAIVNRTLDEEELAIVNDHADEIRQRVGKRKEDRDAAKAAQEKELQARATELERLAGVGKVCEAHHKALEKEHRAMRDDVKRLRKEVEKLHEEMRKKGKR